MVRSENFIYFFTTSGFFIGLMFTIINFNQPEDILMYTAEITLFFYLFIHIVIMNFVDMKRFAKNAFDKKAYEEISEYFVDELDIREKRMDKLLIEVEKMNTKYEQENKKKQATKEDEHKKAA